MRTVSVSLAMLLSAATLAGAEPMSPHASYVLHCSGCHIASGEGAPEAGIPTFVGSVGNIARSDAGRTYMMHVPGVVSAGLGDAEIAAVMNYVLDAWGDDAPHFTADEVTARRAVPVGDVVAYRREVAAELGGQGIPIADYPWP